MPRLLDGSPFSEIASEVTLGEEQVRIRANQIILWVTLTRKSTNSPNPSLRPFPVILDTGHSHSFSIRESHLNKWPMMRSEEMSVVSAVRDRGQRLLLRAANIWCHSNERGFQDRLADCPPYGLAAPLGIAVYPGDFPRLPILGLRAIAENELILKVDGRREATLRTLSRWWPFI